jgi:hypothetical protein
MNRERAALVVVITQDENDEEEEKEEGRDEMLINDPHRLVSLPASFFSFSSSFLYSIII